MQIVYTVSTGYSGSTLLSMLMNSHPKIASIGELSNTIGHFLNRREQKSYPCSCKNDITECPFWKQVQKQCLEYGVTLDLYDFKAQLYLGFGDKINKIAFSVSNDFRFLQSCRDFILERIPLYRNTVNQTLDRNLIITRTILEVAGKQIFFDASKNSRITAKLSKRNDIDFKLLHLARDPRGILNSILKRNQNATVEFVGNHWTRIHSSALGIKANLPSQSYLLVHYESLCSNPRETLRRICQFLNVEDVDLVSDAMQQEHHLIGNEMRGKPLENIRLDEAWRTNLTTDQLSEIKRITNKMSLTLGYELD